MAKRRYIRYGFTGNAASDLDSIDGDVLNDLDETHVYISSNVYHYTLEAGSGATANSPNVIAPVLNPGTKRWILYQSGGTVVSNTDVDTGTETVDIFPDTDFKAAWWEYVVSKGVNLRAGLITATWDATDVSSPAIQYSERSTEDVGDTSGLTFVVDLDTDNVRLRATATSDNWSVQARRRSL